MGERLIFDIETNGLLPDLTKLHGLTIIDLVTGDQVDYADHPGYEPIARGLKRLAGADLLVGHNIQNFDLRAIKKVYPDFTAHAIVRDTLILAKLFWPHIADEDHKVAKRGKLPKQLIGAHSLEAWGHRLKAQKGDFDGGDWQTWSVEMMGYMRQDGTVTRRLWERCEKTAANWGLVIDDVNPPVGKDCIQLEHDVARICDAIQEHGFRFNVEDARFLEAKLKGHKIGLVNQLQNVFPPRLHTDIFIPKKDNKTRGYKAGVPAERGKVRPFNPGSRKEVAHRLQLLGWKPAEFTSDGTPKVDDEILNAIVVQIPTARLLADYYMVEKRLGQLAQGQKAWLKFVSRGRIHGRINSGGAHTGRATHSNPNIAQVPGCDVPYGHDCRALFMADEGEVLVGVDADALELRDLAGYMAHYDGGAYIETVLHGDKSKGTDMHTINAKLIGCTRDVAKVFFYAMIYGSGDENLGNVLGIVGPRAMAAGKRAREALMRGLPALGRLVTKVQETVRDRGYLIGLDGRRLFVRSKNASLNTLLQSAGAVQIKRSLVHFVARAEHEHLIFGRDYAVVAWVHDEFQITTKPELAERVGSLMVDAIRAAGTFYRFLCHLDGQAKVGKTWADTH